MEFKPSKRYIGLLRLRLMVACAILCFINGAVYCFGRIPALILGVGIFVLFIIGWWWYIPHFVKAHSAIINGDVLSVLVGVIITSRHILPNRRCVCFKRMAGPMFKIFGLATVQIKLTNGVVTVHGLSTADAMLLADWGKE